MGEMLKLTSAARIVVRPGPAIQFGIDATAAGVIDGIEPHHIGAVVGALASAKSPVGRTGLAVRLSMAGLNPTAAEQLVGELLAFGILRSLPTVEPRVALLGRSSLSALIAELLNGSGCTVRRPLRGETDGRFLRSLPGEMPLVAVDKLAHARVLAGALRGGRRELFVPVQLVDGRGVIGPLRSGGLGPCPLCTQLHRTDVDPHWPHLLTQLPGAASAAPVTVAATAAHAAAMVLAHYGLDRPPLGTTSRRWQPGLVLDVDPFGELRESVMASHPHCPLCFESQNIQQSLPEARCLDRANS